MVLAACQAKTPVLNPRPSHQPSTAPQVGRSPTPAASTAAQATASPAGPLVASSKPLASAAPLLPVAYLAGTVRVDAAYVLGQAKGQLVSDQGGLTLKVQGLSGNRAAGFGPEAAASLVGNHGGSLIGNQGGALLSNHGAGLVGNHGSSWRLWGAFAPWRLAQAEATASAQADATASLALGQQLPAQDLAVRAFDLATGEALPLLGASGEDLVAVATGADGSYLLRLAKAPQDQVLVTAELPGAQDARLALRVLAQASGSQAEASASPAASIDEEGNAAVAIVRLVFQRNLAGAMTAASLAQFNLEEKWRVPQVARDQMVAALEALRGDAKALGFGGLKPSEQEQVAAGAADAILGTVKLDELMLDPNFTQSWKGPREPMLPALKEVLRFTAGVAAKRLQEAPQALASDPDLASFNALRAPATPFQILRPADFNAFYVEAFLASGLEPTKRAGAFIGRHNAGVLVDPGSGQDQVARLRAAMDAFMQAVGLALLSTEGQARAAAQGRMKADIRPLLPLAQAEAIASP